MKNRAALFLSVLVFLWLALVPATATESPDLATINSTVDRYFRQGKTVGGSLVIMKDGAIVYERHYGQRDTRKKLPVDENTYFKMGCVTKMVSSLAILQLLDEGLVDLDEDIGTYLGYPVANPNYPRIPLTLRQLLSHTSSLSEEGGYSNYSNQLQALLSVTKKSTKNYRKVAPGSNYQYSNFGSGVVGSIVEKISGQSVNRFVTERLFEPLGMDASLAASWLTAPENIASLYKDGKIYRTASKYVGEGYEDTASPETHYRTMVGGLFIKARDLATITNILATDGSLNGHQFLKPETIMEMRQEQYLLGKSVTGKSPYGLFLERNTRVLPGKVVWGHQGMTGASSNNTYFEPDTGFVFVVTTNGCSQARDHGTIILAQNLLRYTYPLFSGNAD